MCDQYSCLVRKDLNGYTILDGMGLTHSHADLCELYGFDDDEMEERVLQVEIQPWSTRDSDRPMNWQFLINFQSPYVVTPEMRDVLVAHISQLYPTWEAWSADAFQAEAARAFILEHAHDTPKIIKLAKLFRKFSNDITPIQPLLELETQLEAMSISHRKWTPELVAHIHAVYPHFMTLRCYDEECLLLSAVYDQLLYGESKTVEYLVKHGLITPQYVAEEVMRPALQRAQQVQNAFVDFASTLVVNHGWTLREIGMDVDKLLRSWCLQDGDYVALKAQALKEKDAA